VPARLAAIAFLFVIAALLSGCGSSSDSGSTGGEGGSTQTAPSTGAPAGAAAESCETFAADAEALRATNVPCERARRVMYGWQRQPSCALPAGGSRGGCRSRSYRCQAVRSDRGIAVSCARAGESVAFIARRG
jgi:uncharacterized protein YceK